MSATKEKLLEQSADFYSTDLLMRWMKVVEGLCLEMKDMRERIRKLEEKVDTKY